MPEILVTDENDVQQEDMHLEKKIFTQIRKYKWQVFWIALHSFALIADLTLTYYFGSTRKDNIFMSIVDYALMWTQRFTLVYITWNFVK